MPEKSDAQLLRDYARHGDESAFAELIRRHTNLVYSAAARQVDSPDLAAEVAQSVFIGLARGAQSLIPRLAPDASLAGWLCRSARNVSLNLRRDEFRRHSRERQAMQQLDSISESAPDWEQLRPVLDEAMSELDETDYDALVLRFFKNQDLRSVGLAQGVSDDTAQKRVSRALDKLRDYLSRRGIRTTTTALSVVLTTNAVQAAPAGLAITISTAPALAGSSIATTTATTITAKTIAMTTIQKTLIATVALLLCGTTTFVVAKKLTARSSINAPVINLDNYTGRFETPGYRLDIQKKDAGISVYINGQPAFVAYPQSGDKFVSHDHNSITELAFVRDVTGRAAQLKLVRDGRRLGDLHRTH